LTAQQVLYGLPPFRTMISATCTSHGTKSVTARTPRRKMYRPRRHFSKNVYSGMGLELDTVGEVKRKVEQTSRCASALAAHQQTNRQVVAR
jgi:hypothetical protein